MHPDKPSEFEESSGEPTKPVLSYMEFKQLLAQYRMAVYTNWVAVQLATDRRENNLIFP